MTENIILYPGSSALLSYTAEFGEDIVQPATISLTLYVSGTTTLPYTNPLLWDGDSASTQVLLLPVDIGATYTGEWIKGVWWWQFTDTDGKLHTFTDKEWYFVASDLYGDMEAAGSWATRREQIRRIIEETGISNNIFSNDALLAFANDAMNIISTGNGWPIPVQILDDSSVVQLPVWCVPAFDHYVLARAFELIGDFNSSGAFMAAFQADLGAVKYTSQQIEAEDVIFPTEVW